MFTRSFHCCLDLYFFYKLTLVPNISFTLSIQKMSSNNTHPVFYLHLQNARVTSTPAYKDTNKTRLEFNIIFSVRPNANRLQSVKVVFQTDFLDSYTKEVIDFLTKDAAHLEKDDMVCISGDVECHAYYIGGRMIYSPQITPEGLIKVRRKKSQIALPEFPVRLFQTDVDSSPQAKKPAMQVSTF